MGSGPSKRPRPRRIDAAVQCLHRFTATVFCPGDRCSFATFNDDVNVQCVNARSFATLLPALHGSVSHCGGRSRLYDAIVSAVGQFLVTADTDRPQLLLLLTAGSDHQSRHSLEEARQALGKFLHGRGNAAFIVGLGDGLDAATAEQLTATGSHYLPAADAKALEPIIALIAMQVSTDLPVIASKMQVQDVEWAWAQIVQVARPRPLDLCLLLDVGLSMAGR
eukprot:EG_transcript_18381